MYRILLFLFLAFTSVAGAQTYPQIHASRPRIYIDSARFAYLRNNISSGDCGTTHTNFTNAVNSNWYNDPQLYLLGTDSSLWTWTFSSNWAKYQAFFPPTQFMINLDALSLKRCRFLINKLNDRFDTLNFANYSWFTNEDEIRHLADMGGILLDWCYDSLPVPMRQHLAQNMYRVARYFMNTYITSSAGNSYVSSHNAWNTVFANQFALVLDSADGLTPLQHDTVEQWYQITYDKFQNGFFPCYGYYRDDDGGWNWTAAYAMWSLVDQFQYFENMRIATGKDFYTDLPWVHNSINQYWHFLQPDSRTINWGDGFMRLQGDRVIYMHARMFNDPRSVWLAQEYALQQNITWTWPLYQKLLYRDFTATAIPKPDPAHDWFSDKTGLSVSRTGWNTTDALVWMYNAPSKKSAHEHRDNNTFCVYKNAPQIIHSGYYDSYGNTHYTNYYMRTIAHNSICVFDSTDQYMNWNVNVSNDGGQNESPTLQNFNDIFSPNAQKGKWVLWGSNTNYCYQVADAEQSYDTSKLDRFRRRVLFYKPDEVLVLDHVHLKNTQTAQRDAKFILHFQKQPQVSGTLTNTTVPGHIETFNGTDITQANGNGNVAIRTLLPQNTKTTRIGGTGYEFYVNGVNYPVAATMDTVNTTPGKWRIETSPVTVTDSLVFFHTIKIGDNTAPATAGGIGEQNAFTIGTDWNNTLFFFNAQGDTGVLYQVLNNIAGGRTVGIFGADLSPNSVYDVLVDNVVYTTLPADTNGVVETTVTLAPGTHRVEISQHPLGIAATEAATGLFRVYPNPANTQLVLQPLNPGEPIETAIYNSSGRLVSSMVIYDRTILGVQDFSPGLYIITVRQGGAFQAKRVLIAR